MIRNRRNIPDHLKGEVRSTLKKKMKIFDELPGPVRKALCNAPLDFCVHSAARWVANGRTAEDISRGIDRAVEALREHEKAQ